MADDTDLTPRKIKRYGWIPDLPDARDHLYAAPVAALRALPTQVDLRPQCPKQIYDQGQLGSCTGNAIAGAIQFDRLKQKLTPDFIPSRLFIYYNERVIEDTVHTDSGAQIRDGIKSVAKKGVCPEDPDWPYEISKFAEKPSKTAFKDALKNKAVQYSRVAQTRQQMKGCLASRLPIRVRLLGLRELRERPGREERRCPNAAPDKRAAARRARRHGGRLRRYATALHRPQLVGRRLGHGGLLHDALCLFARERSGRRPLDHPPYLGLDAHRLSKGRPALGPASIRHAPGQGPIRRCTVKLRAGAAP